MKKPDNAFPQDYLHNVLKGKVGTLFDDFDLEINEGVYKYNTHLGRYVYQTTFPNLGPHEVSCEIDVLNLEVIFFNDLNQQSPSQDVELPEPVILKIAPPIYNKLTGSHIPDDAQFKGMIPQKDPISGHRNYEGRWERVDIAGDYISITINPVTIKVFNFVKKWRE